VPADTVFLHGKVYTADAKDDVRQAFAVDLPIEAQVTANGVTGLDRQLLAREPVPTGGFGAEVRDAMERPVDDLASEGLARL
jgi:Protein of unknown function (DUF3363)